VEPSGLGLIEVLFGFLPPVTEDNHETPQLGYETLFVTEVRDSHRLNIESSRHVDVGSVVNISVVL
jgi:hypothetical protein